MDSLTVRKEGNQVFLSGIINEFASLDECFTGSSGLIKMNLRNVTRINSSGIHIWIKAFQDFQDREVHIYECPTAIVTHVNMIPNFIDSQQVQIKSYYVNYVCDTDYQQEEQLISEGEHYQRGVERVQLPVKPCPICGEDMEIEELLHSRYIL